MTIYPLMGIASRKNHAILARRTTVAARLRLLIGRAGNRTPGRRCIRLGPNLARPNCENDK